MRRTTTKTTKDWKSSSRASAGEGRDHVHVSSHVCVQSKKTRAEDRVPPTLPPTGRRPTFAVPA
jgi:hypothetical protein